MPHVYGVCYFTAVTPNVPLHRMFRRSLSVLCVAYFAIATGLPLSSHAADALLALAQVRQVPAINGGATVDGSIHAMSPGAITLNGGAAVIGDLLVPGTPSIGINGKPAYGGTVEGAGSASPTNYTITLNGNTTLGHIVRRTDPVAIASLPAPTAPAGTRTVTLDSASQSTGDWTTLRDLTLNGNVGQIAVLPGAYGDFTANGGSGFTLGVANSSTPTVYHFQRITLNGQARVNIVGPVILNLADGLSANGTLGSSDHPEWLALNISAGGLTLNGGCTVYAFVNTPSNSGTVIINGNSALIGGLVADRLIVNGGGLLRLHTGVVSPVNVAPVAQDQSLVTPEDAALDFPLIATDADGDALAYTLVDQPAHGTLTPPPNTLDRYTYPPAPMRSPSAPATDKPTPTSPRFLSSSPPSTTPPSPPRSRFAPTKTPPWCSRSPAPMPTAIR